MLSPVPLSPPLHSGGTSMVAVSATWDKAHDPLRTVLEELSGRGGSAGLDRCLIGEGHCRSDFLFSPGMNNREHERDKL